MLPKCYKLICQVKNPQFLSKYWLKWNDKLLSRSFWMSFIKLWASGKFSWDTLYVLIYKLLLWQVRNFIYLPLIENLWKKEILPLGKYILSRNVKNISKTTFSSWNIQNSLIWWKSWGAHFEELKKIKNQRWTVPVIRVIVVLILQ